MASQTKGDGYNQKKVPHVILHYSCCLDGVSLIDAMHDAVRQEKFERFFSSMILRYHRKNESLEGQSMMH